MEPNKKFMEEQAGVHLLQSEKSAMKAAILSAAPAIARPIPSPFMWWTRAGAGVFAVALIAVAPVSYLAQASHPGDALYSLEVNVIEPVEEVFYSTADQKISYHTARLEERLDEMQESGTAETSPEAYVLLAHRATEHAEEVQAASASETPLEQLDTLVETAALMQANEDLLEAARAETDEFDASEARLRADLSTAIEAYSEDATEEEAQRALSKNIAETSIALDATSTVEEISELATLLDAIEASVEADEFEDAVQSAIHLRIEAMKRGFLEGSTFKE